MSKEELKLCPFCGEEARVRNVQVRVWFVECGACESSIRIYVSRKDAIKAWNRRTK